MPYRRRPIEQANEPDADRRAAIEAGAAGVLDEQLNPLHGRRSSARTRLRASSAGRATGALCEELRGARPRGARAPDARRFVEATEAAYARAVDPRAASARSVLRLDELRRSDLPRFFRAAQLDALFPADAAAAGARARRSPAWASTSTRQPNVTLDTEPRPRSSPRAFCSPSRVPERGLPGDPADRAGATTSRRSSTRAATPSTTRTSTRRSPSSSATSATTRSRRPSRSCSST